MKATIQIDELNPIQVSTEVDGVSRSIHMSLEDLMKALKNSAAEHEEEEGNFVEVVSSTLPTNTVRYARLSDGTEVIAMIAPEENVDVLFHTSEIPAVRFPNLVFVFKVSKHGNVNSIGLACYKDRFLRDDTQLLSFPFSNVFGKGELCYYDRENIKDLVQLQTFVHNWRTLRFNNHLYSPSNTKWEKPLREVFELLQHQTAFPYEKLLPLNGGMDFTSLFMRYTN